MKIFGTIYVQYLCLVLVLLCAVLSAGCATQQKKAAEQPLLQVTPEITQNQNQALQPAFGSQTGMTTATLDYGITISYPVDWRKEEKGVSVLRDYGRTVVNIANFYSPDITSNRAEAAAPNPDKSRYTTLSVDVDPAAAPDFERYFNLATLAVQNKYASTQITKRNVQLKISISNTFPGYKSYELDFDTPDRRGRYLFTNVDGTIYIFAFRNPSPYSREIEDIYKSIIITPENQ
jgi:hypothetical protein